VDGSGLVNKPGRGAIGLALIHLAFAVVVGLHVAIPFLLPDGSRSDFGYFYRSAVEVSGGGTPYVANPNQGGREPGGDQVVNLNPPFQTALTVPLARLEYGSAMWVWYLSSLAAGIMAGFVMARAFAPRRPVVLWGPLCATLLLLYPPSLANAWLAQLGLVLALLAAVTFRLLLDDRWAAAGVVLGSAAGLKIFLGLFAVFFLLNRRWRALTGFVVAFAGTVVVGGLVVGWSSYSTWAGLLATVDWHSWSWNSSLFGTASRLLGSARNEGLLWSAPPVGPLVGRVAALLVGAAYGWVVLRRGDVHASHELRLGMSLTFVMMLILSPLGWLYYLPCLIPCCMLLVTSSAAGRERAVAIGCVAAFLLLTIILQRPYPGTELMAREYVWWRAEMPLLGMFALAGGHVVGVARIRARNESVVLKQKRPIRH